MDYPKLFTVGPVYVRPEILQEMSMQMFSHRSEEYVVGHGSVIEKLGKLMLTKNDIFLYTSSATGIMESAARNCINNKVLCCVNGAFSKRFSQVCEKNGKEVEVLEKPLGQSITPEELDRALETTEVDSVTIVHNETSSGVMAPLKELTKVAKQHNVLTIVDTVSSMGGAEVRVDKWGIDVCLFSVQKCLAIPPGLAVASVSKAALERSEDAQNKGLYFDMVQLKKYAEKHHTPATPPIPQIFALNRQLDFIFEEGLENVWKRHKEVSDYVKERCEEFNFKLFPEKEVASQTMSCIDTQGVDAVEMLKEMKKQGYVIANGYKDLKQSTFRVGNMGNVYMHDAVEMLDKMEEVLEERGWKRQES